MANTDIEEERMSTSKSTDNEAHRLVEEAHELAAEKLEQDGIPQDDIEEVQDAMKKALDHPDASIWVTIMCEGAKNKLEHQRYPDGEYKWEPYRTNRDTLEEIVSPNVIQVEVS